jgi:hypothetical protein
MMRRMAISICLFFFVSSSSFVAAEPSPDFEQESQTSFWTGDEQSSPEANRARRISKRSPRGKSPLKSLPTLNTPPRVISLAVHLRETVLVPGFSKASVYQQINVYRI